MNTWFQIKGNGIKDKNILVLQNGNFYSKSNTIITNISSKSNVTDVTCNILEGKSINDASVVEYRHISFVEKESILTFLNKILFKFITPITQIDIVIVKKKNGSINTTLTKGNVSVSFQIKKEQVVNKQNQGAQNVQTTFIDLKLPEELFLENVCLFKDLLEPLYSNSDDRSLYVEKWKSVISSIPNSDKLKEEFANYENDINLWFNVLFSWGIKRDQCREYKNCSFNREFYEVEPMGHNSNVSMYKVLTPCWSYIKREEGNNKEIIIKKGLLRG